MAVSHNVAKTVVTLLAAALLASAPCIARAAPLNVVNVKAPDINCVFNPTCTVTVTDSIGTIPGIGGTARLQSRTYHGAGDAPGAAMTAYLYRVDLTQAVGGKPLPCISALKLPFGAPAKLQYDGAGAPDDVYVITAGGLGSIVVASADLAGNVITFNFAKPGVCAGETAGTGTTSFFFGLGSPKPPKPVTGQVQLNGNWVDVAARAPGL